MTPKKVFIYCLAAMLALAACKKEASQDGIASLSSSKMSAIKKGEPVVFTLNGATGSTVDWSVTPDSSAVVNPSGNSAAVSFGQHGSYLVTGISGNMIDSIRVEVDTAVFNGNPGTIYTLQSITGDGLEITPYSVDSGAVSNLMFTIVTKNNFNCLNSFISIENSVINGGYQLNVDGVNVPEGVNCSSGQTHAMGSAFIYPAEGGTQIFSVVVNGNTYLGSFVRNGTGFSFTWPYTSGVIFTRLTTN
jgi:hypothetical protein